MWRARTEDELCRSFAVPSTFAVFGPDTAGFLLWLTEIDEYAAQPLTVDHHKDLLGKRSPLCIQITQAILDDCKRFVLVGQDANPIMGPVARLDTF